MNLLTLALPPLLLVAVAVALYTLERRGSAMAGFYARSLASWGMLVLCALYGTIASIALGLVGKSGLSQWTTARAFKWSMWAATGVTFVVEGEEHLRVRPAVFVGNHQTELDVLMLGCVFPPYCSVSAKASLKWAPVLGWFMLLSKTIFIDRSNRQKSGEALNGAARTITADRQSVFMFAEGTRSHSLEPTLLPFKKGAFHLAVQAQVPVVPIVVANYSYVLHIKSRVFNAGRVPVKVLPPIETKGMTSEDVGELTERVRAAMLKELLPLSERARREGVAMGVEVDKIKGQAIASGVAAEAPAARKR